MILYTGRGIYKYLSVNKKSLSKKFALRCIYLHSKYKFTNLRASTIITVNTIITVVNTMINVVTTIVTVSTIITVLSTIITVVSTIITVISTIKVVIP